MTASDLTMTVSYERSRPGAAVRKFWINDRLFVTRDGVVAEAREWVGTPYRHGQALKGAGCDCIGLIGGVPVALGLPSGDAWAADPAIKGYGRDPDPRMLLPACHRHLVPTDEPGLGDILLLRWHREPHHFAIIVQADPLRIVHAYASARKVCETPVDGYWRAGVRWRDLILSGWRYRELAD